MQNEADQDVIGLENLDEVRNTIGTLRGGVNEDDIFAPSTDIVGYMVRGYKMSEWTDQDSPSARLVREWAITPAEFRLLNNYLFAQGCLEKDPDDTFAQEYLTKTQREIRNYARGIWKKISMVPVSEMSEDAFTRVGNALQSGDIAVLQEYFNIAETAEAARSLVEDGLRSGDIAVLKAHSAELMHMLNGQYVRGGWRQFTDYFNAKIMLIEAQMLQITSDEWGLLDDWARRQQVLQDVVFLADIIKYRQSPLSGEEEDRILYMRKTAWMGVAIANGAIQRYAASRNGERKVLENRDEGHLTT